LYQPVIKIIHKIVDHNLFKIDYDTNQSKSEITNKLNKSILMDDFIEIANNFLLKKLKISKYQILIYDSENDDLVTKSNFNIFLGQHQLYNLKNFILNSNETSIIGKKNIFSDEINYLQENDLLTMLNSEIVYCSFTDEGIPSCILVVGSKNNNILFTSEDAELLVYFVNETGKYFHKINVQKKILYQNDEIKKLEELNQIKNYFISNVSHELKTPLTAISLFSELILHNRNITLSNREEYLNIVIGECERLTRLINNLLDFSKIERGAKEYNFQIIDLNKIVNTVLKSTFYIMKLKKFKLNFSPNENEFLIYGDSDSLKEVFYNLIDNSIKYSIKNKEISINTYSDESNYIFEISDKGMGIKEENQKAIFDAYYRVKDTTTNGIGGTGLGMSIVYNIIKAHKGEIILESQWELGTTIKIILPMRNNI
jgi:signal transduction histidine kinase